MGLTTSLLWGCATGKTPDAKMKNAREETASALGKTYEANLWGSAAQATVQGYKFWQTDFTEDIVQNKE